jgi:3-deoxy-D-manno-octulosonic-acid transferase
VGARSEIDAERFVALGVPEARVRVTGDLKLDPPSHQPALAIDLIRALADVPVVVGGSTHPGEEDALLDAQAGAEKEGHGFVLVIAPRHVERAAEIIRLCQRRRRRAVRRSELEGRHLVPGEVLVLDTLGELSALYATAAVAFVGGTLAPIGGHNLVEPVNAGCSVLFGPHFQDVRKVVEILEVGGAGRPVANSQELVRALIESFDDLEACRLRGEIGRETLEAHRGSVARTHRLIEEVLAARGVVPSAGLALEAISGGSMLEADR